MSQEQEQQQEGFETDFKFSQTLLTVKECFVYKIPPMSNSKGHRAELWNLSQTVNDCNTSSTSLEVTRVDHHELKLQIYISQNTGGDGVMNHNGSSRKDKKLFAECVINLYETDDTTGKLRTMEYYVQHVIDSSRYFVLRLQNKGRQIFIGVGFRERFDAVNFKECLNDYVSSLERERRAEQMQQEYAAESSSSSSSSSSTTATTTLTRSLSPSTMNKACISLDPSTAQERAESPSRSFTSGSAPASNNIAVTSTCPIITAACRALMPSRSVAFTLAPACTSSFAQSAAPLSAAK
mmetsp:Transcript_15998/g.24941  ORF Transcript_15998/g.24941 Transcript_15998/m.24941 type:complete len:295 (-) Transcript_15998:938-1822(-)